MGLKANFRENWLSDPSTYPLIAILGVACGFCGGFCAYKLAYCPDVRITSNTKVRNEAVVYAFILELEKELTCSFRARLFAIGNGPWSRA